jgi:hypothetical protein
MAALGGGILVALLRGWITERLKQSIQHEYAQKLENHKAELNSRLQAISHENQLSQLRMSLFFDHQREAFAKILAAIAEAVREWWQTYDPDEGGLTEPVPADAYNRVKRAYYDHRLFLDSDCMAAVELTMESMRDSFPVDDGSGTLHPRDCRGPFDELECLQDRLPEIFQDKIGLTVSGWAKQEVGLLGAIRPLNHYHFPEIGLPVKGALGLTRRDSPADAVKKADENRTLLIAKLTEFRDYLHRDPSCFHEAETRVGRYLRMLGHTVSGPGVHEGQPMGALAGHSTLLHGHI